MNDSAAIDVLISSHNPDADRLRATLIALETQTMPKDRYSLLIVDNASSEPFDARGHRLIRDERLGLAYGRLAGIKNTTAPLAPKLWTSSQWILAALRMTSLKRF